MNLKNKIKITIITILTTLILLIAPSITMAAFTCSHTEGTSKGTHNGKSFVGMYCAMVSDPLGWIKSDITNITDLWDNERYITLSKEDGQRDLNLAGLTTSGRSMILDKGGICYGHLPSAGPGWYGDYKYNITVLDIGEEIAWYSYKDGGIKHIVSSSASRALYYELAYYMRKSLEEDGLGSFYGVDGIGVQEYAEWKEYIRGWILDHYKEMNIPPQGIDGGYNIYASNGKRALLVDGVLTYLQFERPQRFNEAKQYASQAVQMTDNNIFTSNSEVGDGKYRYIQKKEVSGEEYTFIGPYNLQHQGMDGIREAVVEQKNGGKVNVTLCSIDGQTIQKLSDLTSYSGDNFYLVYKGKVQSIEKIVLKKGSNGNQFLRARIVFGTPIGGATTQNIAAFNSQYDTIGAELKLPGETETKLIIRKTGVGPEDTNEKLLSNVGFTLQKKEAPDQGKYVSLDGQGYAQLSDSPSTLITNNNGEIVIKNLPQGSYELIETVMPYSEYSLNDSQPRTIEYKGKEQLYKVLNSAPQEPKVPLPGNVWEDNPLDGKEGEGTAKAGRNNLRSEGVRDINDKALSNIDVEVKSANGITLGSCKTQEGTYGFEQEFSEEYVNETLRRKYRILY